MSAETAHGNPVSASAMKWLVLPIVLASTTAAAEEWREKPAVIEWSTWVRLGVGVASEPPNTAALAVGDGSFQAPRRNSILQTGLGAELSMPVGKSVRIGAWGELQDLNPFGGLELLVTRAPAELDVFQYTGEGVLMLRAGGNRTHATAAIGWGYRCPWKLWGPFDRTSRYQINVRLVASGTRAVADPRDWSATFGIEFEPIGSIRYLFGIRSWYKMN
jgi:hypothetical protein